jgi:hypothetical protein
MTNWGTAYAIIEGVGRRTPGRRQLDCGVTKLAGRTGLARIARQPRAIMSRVSIARASHSPPASSP